MAKTPEVKKNRINRIRKANQKLQDCVDDAFVKAAGFIENAIYSAGRRAKKAAGKAAEALSIDRMGKFAGMAAWMQDVCDYWIDITFEQLEKDRRFIRVAAKKAWRAVSSFLSAETPGGLGMLAAKLVSSHDFLQGIIYDNLSFLYYRIRKRAVFGIAMLWENRMTIVRYGAGAAIVAICMISVFNYATGYEYSYNGRVLGLVKNQETVSRVVEVAGKGLTKEYGVDVQVDINRDFSFRKVVILNRHADDADEVLAKLTYMQDTKASACGIYAGDRRIATVDTKETAEEILSDILSRYTDSDTEYDYIGFRENVTTRDVTTTIGKLMNEEAAENTILAGGIPLEYDVRSSDTASTIGDRYNMSSSYLKALNPNLSEKLKEDGTVLVSENDPLVTVVTKETKVYTEKKDYKVKRVKTDSLYEGDTKVHQKGVKGKVKVTAVVECENGIEKSRNVISEETVREPVTKIIYVGTKKRPSYVGSGHLINPCPAGYWSSGFGMRWGRLHRGIDMACAAGNPIYAADGGIVVVATYNYSYGNYIKINHQNGMVTTYAHCSALLVSAGDRVGQGELIARVGNTGNSTGAHCHFEVEVNGVLQNPANYL